MALWNPSQSYTTALLLDEVDAFDLAMVCSLWRRDHGARRYVDEGERDPVAPLRDPLPPLSREREPDAERNPEGQDFEAQVSKERVAARHVRLYALTANSR